MTCFTTADICIGVGPYGGPTAVTIKACAVYGGHFSGHFSGQRSRHLILIGWRASGGAEGGARASQSESSGLTSGLKSGLKSVIALPAHALIVKRWAPRKGPPLYI